jgi:hypothetical protein
MPLGYSSTESIKYIQGMSEDRLTKEIIVPLLSEMGFEGMRIEHGAAERGKDLLFWRQDPFGGKEWYACQVKGPRLTGSASGSDSLRTVVNQLQEATDTPFCDPDGNQVFVSKCLLITSSALSPTARESIMGLLAKQRVVLPTRVVDAPELVSLIKKHKPALLMPWQENLSEYCRRLYRTLRLHLDYKALGLQEQPVLEDFYIDVSLLLEKPIIYMRPWENGAEYVVLFEPAEQPALLRCRNRLEKDCSVRLRISEKREIVTRLTKTVEGRYGIEQASDTYREVKEEVTIAFAVDYRELAERLWHCVSEVESRGLGGTRLDARLDDLDLTVIIRTLTLLRAIFPCLPRFGAIVSELAKPGFREVRLSNVADPGFLFQKIKKLWMLGHAGTGKSTLCRYHTFILARSFDIEDTTSLIPVMIPLCSYNQSLGSLRDAIVDNMQRYGMDVSSIPIDEFLEKGRFIVFLDGYDEIPTGTQRNLVLSHLSEFERVYGDNHIVVTSRYVDIPTEFLSYVRYGTALFTNEEIMTFCERWFRNDQDKSDRLSRLIISSETFRVLCRNPLYLTLVAALIENNRPIPQRRVELHRERLDLLLQRWDYSRGVFRNKYEPELKLHLLRKLAFSLHQHGLRAFHYEDYADVASTSLPYRFRNAQVSTELLAELIDNNALIRRIDDDTYDFGHLSFQEYLTALEIVEMGDYEIVWKRIGMDWWRQPCLLACGIKRAADDVLMKLFEENQEELMKEDSILFLAAEIIAEADWTSDPVVRNVALGLLDRYRRKGMVECVTMVLAMRNKSAYRVLFDRLRTDTGVLGDAMVQNALWDAAGTALYDEVVGSFPELPQMAQNFFVNLMRRRGTSVEHEYLSKIQQIVRLTDQS